MGEPLDEQSDTLGSLASVLNALAATPGAPPPLDEGEVVAGKYTIEEAIGHGGMGVVYRARDERLHRTVALKLGNAVSASSLARLEQEAQTLARLSHPNVVVIHEVGEHAGRVFVAMEYAKGGSARTWLAAEPRSWREVVALYAAAGDGLAAAHDASIIHRDFKPDNVIVGEDDRPRVADFGLARALEDASAHDGSRDADDVTEAEAAEPSRAMSRLTVAGVAVGTLPYMAPEQLAAAPLDARADQFAFCVSLWEALFGVRPFEGDTAPDLRAAIETQPPRVPPHPPRRPAGHVVETLKRGLRFDAKERWPSMRVLVGELRRDPLARWRRAGVVAVAVLGVASAGLIIRLSRHHEDPCDGGAGRQSKVWNATRATAFEQALSAAGGATAARTLRAGLDAYSNAWVDAERDACRATRVVGNQSEAILDRRMVCLRSADAQLDSMVAEATANPQQMLAHANGALTILPDLRSCADVSAIASQATLPADPALRREIDALGADLAKIRTRNLLLSAPTSRADADAALVTAKRIGWAPLVSDATYARALVLSDEGGPPAREALEAAVNAALASNSDELAANAAAELARAFAEGGDVNEARRWQRVAQSESARVGDPPGTGARIASIDALILHDGPHPADALAARRRQVELSQRAHRSPIEDANNQMNLVVGLMAAGQLDDAAHELDLGMTQIRAAVGDDQPALLDFLGASAVLSTKRGRLEEAEATTHTQMTIAEHWFGAESRQVAGALENLSAIQQRRGQMAEAEASALHALTIFDRLDARGPEIGELNASVALMAIGKGDLEQADRRSARALAILERTRGKESVQLIDILLIRAAIAREQKHPETGEPLQRRAVAIADSAGGAVDRVNPRIELSYTLVAMGQAAEAARVLAPMEDDLPQIEPRIAAEFHTAFADALVRSGNRSRAHDEGKRAVTAFTALGDDFAPQRKSAVAWLAAH